MAPKFRFAEGEKVLCFHGPLLYEAKCIKVQAKDKVIKYYIHYSGWNKNWDEWVPESRVLKYNESNVMRQKELAAAHSNNKKTKAVKGGTKKELSDRESSVLPPQEKEKTKPKAKETSSEVESEAPVDMQRKKKNRAEQNVETEEEHTQKLEIKTKIPDELKHWLVEDWKMISLQKLYKLPARIPIETIFEDYIKNRLSVKGMTPNKESAIRETVAGIREYFNAMLQKQLLFKEEKSQHAELTAQNPDLTPAQIYGPFHLLRVFTKIGRALAYTQLDEDSIIILNSNMLEFLKYLVKCSATYFNLNDYEDASAEYKKNNPV